MKQKDQSKLFLDSLLNLAQTMFHKMIIGVTFSMLSLPKHAPAQTVVKEYTASSFTSQQYTQLKQEFGKNKTIPIQFEKQILIALRNFPELKNSRIIFSIKHTYTPLSSRPQLGTAFNSGKNRTYIITISDSTIEALNPLLLKNLPFNAQVGVISHEISHSLDFQEMNSLELFRIALGNLSSQFLDRFEYHTDGIAIAHGFGYQLLSWSKHVRSVLMTANWDGANNIRKKMNRERYMNPATIENSINSSTLYLSTLLSDEKTKNTVKRN